MKGKNLFLGLMVLVILLIAYFAYSVSQDATVPEQNFIAPTLIAPSVALPPGFATLEPVVTDRTETNPTDVWFHNWGPVLAVGLVILMLFGSNVSIIRGVK